MIFMIPIMKWSFGYQLVNNKNDSLLCPLCLFSQFYTKIDFLENFATEPNKQFEEPRVIMTEKGTIYWRCI